MKMSVVRARSFGPEGPQDEAIPRGGMAMGGGTPAPRAQPSLLWHTRIQATADPSLRSG